MAQAMQQTVPVQLQKVFGDDGMEAALPSVNDSEELTQQVYDTYGVESTEELKQEIVGSYTGWDERRLGVVKTDGEEREFVTDAELLATVEGIDEELAEGLIEMCNDIPTMCARQRRDGDVFLGEVRNDAEVENREWVDKLEAFNEEINSFERRMKHAGVWVEPEDEVAF